LLKKQILVFLRIVKITLFSQTGSSIPELINNAFEASTFYFEDAEIELKHDDLKFEIDFKQFFEYYKVIDSKFSAEKIGMSPSLLSKYVKGSKKPSEKQAEKILYGIHKIGQELSEINLIYKH
jgi:transcriptional regulator with XRE-family HTH domain